MLKEYGTLVIAFLALIQPWVITLWKKFFKPGKIDFFETGSLEIGFSNLASTIGIIGTLRASQKDLFIQNIELELTKLKDSSKHHFSWGVFRDTRIPINNNKEFNPEIPHGFLVSANLPKAVNIQFNDKNQQNELRPISNKLLQNWNKYLKDHYPYNNMGENSENIVSNLYNQFLKENIQTQVYDKFREEFYWEPGKYHVTMKIFTSSPDYKFEKKWYFTLTEEDVELLKLNIVITIDSVCSRNKLGFNFIYPDFESE